MAVAQWPLLAALLLLISSGPLCSSPLPACPGPCTCQGASLLNCSSSGLSLLPQHIQDSVTELDLSHNLLNSVTLDRQHHNLQSVWLGNNSITRLSLCIERDLEGRRVRGRHLHRLRPQSTRGCASWAPTLQLLSVERNQLEQLPEGLEGTESLQVLQLSFNRISTLQPGDLSHLRQLKELHLQHNLITSLHPQMFQDLAQLRVLDVSFNMLTSLHPLMYLSLHNIGADVRLNGNRWQCDCSMRGLRRRMAYDSGRGRQSWSVVCASPSTLSGRELLQLEEDDLNCFGTEDTTQLHKDVTVYSGSEILLSCSSQDSTWWTPSGQASMSQRQDGLVINDITERDTGLYVCVSEEHEVVSVFNLKISKVEGARRKPRSLPRTGPQTVQQDTPNRIGQERNLRATQSDLTLAVCLSVFITFLIAFILGVLARPCIDILWRRVTNKRRSPQANSVSTAEQRQYDNEAYDSVEALEEPHSQRERRVTFSTVDFIESNNVQYYDTVVSGDQENTNTEDDAVTVREAAKPKGDRHAAGVSGSESSSQHSSPEENRRNDITNAGRKHNMEFEHIPDPVELEQRRSSSSSSDSSRSDKVCNEDQIIQRDHRKTKSPELAEASVQQSADFLPERKVEVPQISIEGSESLEFSSEPFADWSPHMKNRNLGNPDLWQENGELFEFSDSVRSSIRGSFNDSKPIEASTKQRRDDSSSSSSSSYVSDGEPTEYTLNSDYEKEEDVGSTYNKPVVVDVQLKQNALHTQVNAKGPKHSSSSHSSDSDEDQNKQSKGTATGDTKKVVVPMPRTKYPAPSVGVSKHGKTTRAPPPPAAHSSSSSSESEAEIADLIKIDEPKARSTNLEPQLKRSLDINASLPASDSTSSDESTDETTKHAKRQEQGVVDMAGLPAKEYKPRSNDVMKSKWPSLDFGHVTPSKRRSDKRVPSPATDSSSSSENDDGTKDQKQRQGYLFVTKTHLQESQTASQINKAPTPASNSSSSSDSEDETRGQIKKHMPGKADIAGSPFQQSQRDHRDPETRWPAQDLKQTTKMKQHLDIKVPSPASDSSSSSDSEDANRNQIRKQMSEKINVARLPNQVSQTKAPRPDSSSSSDSEEETTSHIEKQEKGETNTARYPIGVSQTASQTKWPALDLKHTTHVKRRLDIKAPSLASESSSSSDSENETTGQVKKQEKGQANMARLPILSQTNIKAPAPQSDSSSSSDSEAETTGHIRKQEHGQAKTARLPVEAFQTASHEPQKKWPSLDLEHTTRVKRRLDIKAPSRASESSSSSDGENETRGKINKQGKGQTNMAKPPIQVSQTKSPRPDSDSSSSSDSEEETARNIKKQENRETNTVRFPMGVSQTASQQKWPVLDLENTTHVKRRLDIKAPSPASGTSSSNDSEAETTGQIKKQAKGETNMARNPIFSPTNIKAPTLDSDSSSSSDSEAETTGQVKKQKPAKVDIAVLPLQGSQTSSHDAGTRWPVLDLGQRIHIKRRLDIKAPSLHSDSSSSSDSETETTHHVKKKEQGLTNMTRLPINVSQTNIKAPTSHSDSSSSSDSDVETMGEIKKQKQGQTNMEKLPIKVSHTASHDPQKQWPVLDLENTTRIKRRLDIKAPSPASESSSSSDSESETGQIKKWERGETSMTRLPNPSQSNIKAPKADSDSTSSSESEAEPTGHKEKEKTVMGDFARLPFQESLTASRDTGTKWPALDLGQTIRIKRRLDIKAPSPHSDSSSNSDSETETMHHVKKKEQGLTKMARLPINVSQTNIKAPTPHSDSSSSSDSDVETMGKMKKQKQGQTNMEKLPIKVPHTASHDPQKQWPVLDLENTTRIKRRLDIKAPSPASESSSSSDSESETTGQIQKQVRSETSMTRLPILSQTNIKAPKPHSDSSSSSDSETETTGHRKKQEQGYTNMARLPIGESPNANHDPQTPWPILDLERSTRIKRRLDVKAPSQASRSSSSSDSEAETTGQIKKQSPVKVDIAGLSFKESQTVHRDPQTRRPALDHEHGITKGPSPPTDSSSTSESEDETTHHTKEEKPELVVIAGLPFKVSQTSRPDSDKQWPTGDLGYITRIKRRLDIKTPSPPSDSLLSGERTSHTVEGKRKGAIKNSSGSSSSSSHEQEEGTEGFINSPRTMKPDPDSRWPKIGLSNAPHVKRRLNIKARSSPPDSSSSSSEGEGGTTDLSVKLEKDKTDVGITSSQPQKKLPDLNINIPLIKKRLDIKAPSPQPDPIHKNVSRGSQSSSSTSDSEDENRDHAEQGLGQAAISKAAEEKFTSPKIPVLHSSHSPKTDYDIKLSKYTVMTDDMRERTTSDSINTTPGITPELQSKWASMNLGISRFRKRLEISPQTHEQPNLPSSPPPDSPSSATSDNETGIKSSRTRRNRWDGAMQRLMHTPVTPENKPVNVALSLKGQEEKFGDSTKIIEKLRKESSLPKTEEKSKPEAPFTGFSDPLYRRYLGMKDSEKAPAKPTLRSQSDSSSSSDEEDASTEPAGKGWRGRSQQPVITDKKASQIATPLYVNQPTRIKLDQSQSQTEKVKGKVAVKLQSPTSKVGESERDMVDHGVPDRSLGVLHVNRHMNVKARSSGSSSSSSSSSENENEVTGDTAKQIRHQLDMSGDDSIITYKRSIFSGIAMDYTNQGDTGAETETVAVSSLGVGGRNESLSPRRVPSMSFDDVIRKKIEQSKQTTNVEVPPEIRWTGVGRLQSDRSATGVRRHLDVGLSTPSAQPELNLLDSSNYSSGKSDDRTPMHNYSSLSANSVPLASKRALDKFDNSPSSTNKILTAAPEERKERRGLSALKALSSERQKWDIQSGNVNRGESPLFKDDGPRVETSFFYQRYEKDVKTLAEPSQTQLHLSTASVYESRAADVFYDIPRYRRHDFGGTEPPQEAPPPVPATPPPDEAVELTWSLPQTSMRQGMAGTRSYMQQTRNTVKSDLSLGTSQDQTDYFDISNPNISHV